MRMAEYQVPQFIEVEDKIFGPLTFKQFVYLAGGAGLCVVLVLYLHVIGVIIALPIAAFSAALAFFKINDRPFTDVLESGFNYYLGGRLYLWKKDESPTKKQAIVAPVADARQKLGLSQNKLHELAWSLDIKDQNKEVDI
jgi:hypothetical protein